MSKSQKESKIWTAGKKIGFVLYTLLIGLIGGFITYEINPVIDDWFKNPIEHSPKHILITPYFAQQMKQEMSFPFNLLNRKEKAYFTVWIKIIPRGGMDYLSPTIMIEPQIGKPKQDCSMV